RLLDVQDLSTQRQDRLVLASAALLGRPAGRVSLDDEELREHRVPFLAVGELPRQAAAVERALAAREVLGLTCRLAYAGRLDALQDHTPALGRMLFEVDGEAIIHQRLDRALHLAVAQLRLRLPLELGLGHLTPTIALRPPATSPPCNPLSSFLTRPLAKAMAVIVRRKADLEAAELGP